MNDIRTMQIAQEIITMEPCCELVGGNSISHRYIGAGIRKCRRRAKWKVYGSMYCTLHAKKKIELLAQQ